MSSAPIQFDPIEAIDTFRDAAQKNLDDPSRDGSIVRLPGYGQAVMTGDLHGNHSNLDKLQRYAALDRWPARHVILHEMVHAETTDRAIDHSHEVLLRAARYKRAFPEQVHFMQSNHELSQLTAYPIAKNGRAVIDDFNNPVEFADGSDLAGRVRAAIDRFTLSFPCATRARNRTFSSPFRPSRYDMDDFDASIFDRPLRPEDLAPHGPVFQLVWGRRQGREQLDTLAKMLDVDIFIVGHQPQETGFDVLFDRMIILASEHSHGTFLPFDLAKTHRVDDLIANIRKFVAIV